METNKILQTNLLDLVFDGRNKEYGAYELRKNYNKRVVTSLGIVLGSIVCFVVFNMVHAKNAHNALPEVDKVLHFVDVNTKPIEPLKAEKPKPKPQEKPRQQTAFTKTSSDPVKFAITKNVPPRIVPDDEFDPSKNLKKADDLIDKRIGHIDQIGDNRTIVAPAGKVEGPGGTELGGSKPGGGGTDIGDGLDENGFGRNIQKEAQFPTGKDGWMTYLHRSLRSDVPTENGAPAGRNYTVIVSFVVDVDGTVSNVVAENDPGFGTAAEAVRAIRTSGKWIPAMQNNKKVKYRQRQQITFQVTEE